MSKQILYFTVNDHSDSGMQKPFFTDCTVRLPVLNSRYDPDLEHKEIIILCILLFPGVGRTRASSLFKVTDGIMRRFVDNIYSPSKKYNLSNKENRIGFFQEIQHEIEIQYKTKTISFQEMVEEFRREFFILQREEASQDIQPVSELKLNNWDILFFILTQLPPEWTEEKCWDFLMPKLPLKPMSPLIQSYDPAEVFEHKSSQSALAEHSAEQYIQETGCIRPTECYLKTPTFPSRAKF